MTAWRWRALGVSVICLAASGVNAIFAGQDLLRLIHGFAERRPVIVSAHYSVTGLVLAPMGISLGLLFLLGKQATPEEMKRAAGRRLPWASRYLVFLAASLIVATIAPIVQYAVVDAIAVRHGYVSCPTPDWPRHQPDRWALPVGGGQTGRCPGRGANPEG